MTQVVISYIKHAAAVNPARSKFSQELQTEEAASTIEGYARPSMKISPKHRPMVEIPQRLRDGSRRRNGAR